MAVGVMYGAAAFSRESLLSAACLPCARHFSTVDAGWTAVLLERHNCKGEYPTFDTRVTPDQTVVVALRGESLLESRIAGRWRRALYRPGTVGMTPAGEAATLRWRAKGNGTFQTAHLYLPHQFISCAADYYRRAGQGITHLRLSALSFADATVAQTVYAMLKGAVNGAPNMYAESASIWLVTHLLSRYGGLNLDDDNRFPGLLTDRRLAHVVEFMTAHFEKRLTIDQLAAEASLSKFHFIRLFSLKTGTTPHELLVRIRMDAAKRMLSSTDATVAVVSAACGYMNVSSFGSAFTRRHGYAPSEFRKALEFPAA